jgi:S-adenosylmethionine uptake transporter
MVKCPAPARSILMTIPEPRKPRHDTDRALMMMVGSAIVFGLMASTAKAASARLSGAEVSMVRFAIGLTPFFFVPRWRRAALQFQRWDLLLIRGIFGGLAVLAYFFAIQHTSVGVATLLNYSAPIFSGLFSMLFIGERFSAKVLIPLPVAFAGIILVVRSHAGPHDILGFGKWELVGLASAVLSGVAVTAMRVARRTESSWAVYGSFCLFGLLTNAPFGVTQWKRPAPEEWVTMALTGVFAIIAQLLLTHALGWIDAMTAGVISQLAVVIAMLLGAAFLNDAITPMAALGSVLTLGGVIGVMYVTSLHKKDSPFDVAPES